MSGLAHKANGASGSWAEERALEAPEEVEAPEDAVMRLKQELEVAEEVRESRRHHPRRRPRRRHSRHSPRQAVHFLAMAAYMQKLAEANHDYEKLQRAHAAEARALLAKIERAKKELAQVGCPALVHCNAGGMRMPWHQWMAAGECGSSNLALTCPPLAALTCPQAEAAKALAAKDEALAAKDAKLTALRLRCQRLEQVGPLAGAERCSPERCSNHAAC